MTPEPKRIECDFGLRCPSSGSPPTETASKSGRTACGSPISAIGISDARRSLEGWRRACFRPQCHPRTFSRSAAERRDSSVQDLVFGGRYRPATKVTVVFVDSSARAPCRPTLPHRARVRASAPWSLNSCWHSKSGTAMAARSCRAFARDLFGELGLQRRLAGFRHLRKGFRVIVVRVMETAQNASPRHAFSCPSERSATRRARWRTKPPGAWFRLVRPESPSSSPSEDRPPSSKKTPQSARRSVPGFSRVRRMAVHESAASGRNQPSHKLSSTGGRTCGCERKNVPEQRGLSRRRSPVEPPRRPVLALPRRNRSPSRGSQARSSKSANASGSCRSRRLRLGSRRREVRKTNRSKVATLTWERCCGPTFCRAARSIPFFALQRRHRDKIRPRNGASRRNRRFRP